MRIPSQHCNRYRNKQTCFDAKDPYCGWNEHLSQCAPPPDKNPAMPYWNQFINECPSFTHPGTDLLIDWLLSELLTPAHSLISSRLSIFIYFFNINNTIWFPLSVPGGWSKWSSWTPCHQGESLDGTDQCFCSTRQCNNPAPQNGGAECEGVNIRVC